MFYVSQAHLQKFTDCPPSFQQSYLDQLTTPLNPLQLQKQEWGVLFHLAMQQLQAGFELEKITGDHELQLAVKSLVAQLPHFAAETSGDRQSIAEYRQTLLHGEFLLTIICDWVVFGADALEIHDWKTYRQPKEPDKLRNNWQTKLYLYLMATKTDYVPEELSMTYWFVAEGQPPQSLKFQYSQAWHETIAQELAACLQHLTESLEAYFTEQTPFQHATPTNCWYCLSRRQARRSPQVLSSESDIERLLEESEIIEI